MQEKIKVALLQSDIIWENSTENLIEFNKKIGALSSGVNLVVLPEMFSTGFSMKPKNSAESMAGDTVFWMLKKAKEKQIAIIGSLMIKENEKFFNRCVFVEPNGKIETYDKRHLFSYGGEDELYSAGKKRLIIDYKGWKICPLICYDLRFPVWSRNTNDYDILIYVANWPKTRINAWNSLLKARAIENMCYTIGINRVGVDGNNLEYNGHSQVIDMLGDKLVKSKVITEDVVECVLNKNKLTEARKKFGFLNDGDTFTILD